jgi:radical SAM protein with 4Fe4S-binding SPASM domain
LTQNQNSQTNRNQERLQEAQRRRVEPGRNPYHPAYVVWELTLRCDHVCLHCGSRALKPRPNELTTTEALKVVDSLAEMGSKEVVLIGGEAYLHAGFLEIVQALAKRGITPVMTSGGMGITPELAQKMAQAGMKRVSISVDGLESVHNTIRKRKDSFQQTIQALKAITTAGMDASANTHFNRLNQGDLEALYGHLKNLGVRSWQIQITAALGRAADQPQMLFQPWDLIEFVPRVAQLKSKGLKEGLLIMPGNNLGYFGPEEALLRSLEQDGSDHFLGCQAGKYVLGIESQGDIKGCPSLQSEAYIGGNLRQQSLREIWEQSPELAFRRAPIALWGFCQKCPFAKVCQGGCNFTAHALFGRPGNNPYCHFRAQHLAKQGKRERLILKVPAPGQPFDNGRFELIEEDFNAPDPLGSERPLRLV